MATYTLAPVGRQQFFDATGNPLSGGKLYWYQSGTTTPLDTYSDSIGTPNTNPVICDSGGYATVYLQATSYKLVVKNSSDVTQYTVDPVAAVNVAQASSVDSVCGRLTLESGVAISTSDQSAKTTVYFTPYKGNIISLYDGSTWTDSAFVETSLSLAGLTASKPYDIFGYLSSGTFTLEAVAWTNTTTRATALATQDGRYVKSGTTTKRYLGTVYINSTGGQTDDTVLKRYVWNAYNRCRRHLRVADATDSWAYTTGAWRQANNSAANQVDVVIGLAEAVIRLQVLAGVFSTTAGVSVAVGIGEDSTTTLLAEAIVPPSTTLVTIGPIQIVTALLEKMPTIGRHVYSWNEYGGTNVTFYGDGGVPALFRAGMTGSIEG